MKIAVLGSTGMIGAPVTCALADAGFEVTALVRELEKAKTMLPPAVELLKGDLRNADDLKTLLHDKDAVYLNLNLEHHRKESDFLTERDGLKEIIRIAELCKVKRIVFLSSVIMRYQGQNGFNWWVFEMKKNAVDMIRTSGIPYTIFYPSTFMENMNKSYRRGSRMILSGKSKFKMYFIAADDYGKQVAASFRISKTENREFVVQGPDALTADEAVSEYIKHRPGTKLLVLKVPLGILRFFGRFFRQLNYGANILTALNNYPEKFEAEATWRELGTPDTTIAKFAREHP